MNQQIYYIIILALLVSCGKSVGPEIDRGMDYFPLEIGQYREYAVDSIIYDPDIDGIRMDTFHSYLREEVRDTFIDLTGEINFIIDRYKRDDPSEEWVLSEVWHAFRNEFQAESVENNLRFIKMKFPVEEGFSWDGNVYIDSHQKISVAGEPVEIYKNWNYFYSETDLSSTVEGQTYSPVVEVVLVDDELENVIERRYAVEQYAKDIGLIYKEMYILDSQQTTDQRPWEEKAERGFILRQAIISHN